MAKNRRKTPKNPPKEKKKEKTALDKHYNQLSYKHKLFIKNLLKHKFNQTKAYEETYKNSNYDSSAVNANRLLKKAKIRTVLDDLTGKEWIVNKIKEHTHSGKEEISLRALDKLMKYKGLYEPDTLIAQQFNLDTQNTDKELISIIQGQKGKGKGKHSQED